MAVTFQSSLEESNYVLDELFNNPLFRNRGDIQIEGYQNGREQGYSLVYLDDKGIKQAISFSEHRNSDDIVVYFGPKEDKTISQLAYANVGNFSLGEYEEVAEYIYLLLEKASIKPKEGPVRYHHSLEVAKDVLHTLMKDDRSEKITATIESLQQGEMHGYRLVSISVNMFDVAITVEDGKIAIYKGRLALQGLPYDATVQRFELEDIQDAVDYIFLLFDLYA